MTLNSKLSSPNNSPPSDRRLIAGLLLRYRTQRAQHDPDAFVSFCLTDSSGHALQQSEIHRDLQAFLSGHRKALIELPRDHGKSMQICARVLWELGRDPSLRVKIVCATEAVAAERGRFVQEAIARNPLLRLVFPKLRPARPWGTTRFTIHRPANAIGPSVTAMGIGAALTGTRADLLVCDDIVDVRAVGSRSERERIKANFRDNLMNLLEPDGRCWNLFTPWHADDLNSELKRNGSFAHFRRAIDENLTPVWPERWSRKRLEERRQEIGSASFARGYRLVPLVDEEVPIKSNWVKFWIDEKSVETIVLAIDPAVSVKAKADASALVVLGRSDINQIRCLDAIARRVNAPDLVYLIDGMERRWQPDVILFETNAAFAGIKDLLAKHARFGPKIKGVTQSRDKASRVGAFSVLVENGTFKLKGNPGGGVDPSQLALFEEMTTFPLGEHDDLLDAAASGAEYLLKNREPRIWG